MPLEWQAFPEGNDPAVCNQNLPNDSVYHRFLYVIQVRSAFTLDLKPFNHHISIYQKALLHAPSLGIRLHLVRHILVSSLSQSVENFSDLGPCPLQFLARNNFYILIDDHSEDPTVQNDPNLWVQYWTQLMTDITADPISRNRVMVDILNEPDHASYKWDTVCFHSKAV